MKLENILALLKADERITLSCIDVDGTVYTWSFFANNVPFGFWSRDVEKLHSGSSKEGLCIQINN